MIFYHLKFIGSRCIPTWKQQWCEPLTEDEVFKRFLELDECAFGQPNSNEFEYETKEAYYKRFKEQLEDGWEEWPYGFWPTSDVPDLYREGCVLEGLDQFQNKYFDVVTGCTMHVKQLEGCDYFTNFYN